LIALIIAHFGTVALLVGSIIIALHLARDLKVGPDDVLVHYKDDLPLQAQKNLNFLDLTELPKVSLVAFQKPTSLVFKINGQFSDIYRLYTVRAVEFEVSNDTSVTLFLAMGHRLSLTNDTAALFDASGDLLQRYNLDYLRKHPSLPAANNGTFSGNSTSDGQLRQLMMAGKKGYGGMGFGMPVAMPIAYPYPVAPVAFTPPYTPAMTCVNCGLYYGGVPPMGSYY